RKKERFNDDGSDSSEDDSAVTKTTRQNVLPLFTQKKKQQQPMSGALHKPRKQPPWYNARILEEERPDLAGEDGRINLERDEAALMDMFIRGKSDLQIGDLIITDDNLDEEDRKFNRYEVQLKYNEGRYTAIYIISRQVCVNNETEEKNTLFAMKTSIRPYSVNISLRMKRELRMLNELKKYKCPYCPTVLDSGRVADLPFIVMNLLDRNFEKLREQVTMFRPATAYYVAHEALAAIGFLHNLRFIHRDIKTTNLCVGVGPLMTRIYLIDYGDTVRKGKKIRYGTPDAYTLPYWSLDAHRRTAAREKGDIESWFYVFIDLLEPGSLPWSKLNDEKAIEAEKVTFWEGRNPNQMPDSPYVTAIFDLIRTTNFNYHLARQTLREAVDAHLRGPLVLEWAPNLRVPWTEHCQTIRRDISCVDLKTDRTSRTTRSSVDTTMRSIYDEPTARSSYTSVYQQKQRQQQQRRYGRTSRMTEPQRRTSETLVSKVPPEKPTLRLPVKKSLYVRADEDDNTKTARIPLMEEQPKPETKRSPSQKRSNDSRNIQGVPLEEDDDDKKRKTEKRSPTRRYKVPKPGENVQGRPYIDDEDDKRKRKSSTLRSRSQSRIQQRQQQQRQQQQQPQQRRPSPQRQRPSRQKFRRRGEQFSSGRRKEAARAVS
ncbi:hypothetical protein V3C99_009977, partial [Haemonchus contortus]